MPNKFFFFSLFLFVHGLIFAQGLYIQELPILLGEKYAIAFSSDNKFAFVASQDFSDKKDARFSIKVLGIPELQIVRTFSSFSPIEDMICLPEGGRLAILEVEGDAKLTKIIDSESGAVLEILKIKPEDGLAEGFSYYNGEAVIYSTSSEGADITFRLYSLKDMAKVAKVTHSFSHVAFSPVERKVVLEEKSGTMQIYDLESITKLKYINAYHGSVKSMLMSPNGKYIASVGTDFEANPITIWSARYGVKTRALINSTILEDPGTYCFSPNSEYIVSIENGALRVWGTLSGKLLKEIKINENPKNIVFSRSSEYLIFSSNKRTPKFIDFKKMMDGVERNENSIMDFEDKFNKFSKSIEEAPSAEGYQNRGSFYLMIGDFDKAITDFAAGLKISPEDGSFYLHKADAERLKGDNVSAVADYEKVIQLSIETGWAYYGLGSIHLSNDELDKAISDYRKSIDLNVVSEKVHINLGLAYHSKKKYGDAIEEYTKAIDINPNFSMAYSQRGFVYFLSGDYEHAMLDLSKAIELRITEGETYNLRGILKFRAGDTFQAYHDFQKAIKFSGSQDANAIFNLGLIQYVDKNYVSAKENFKQASKINSGNKDFSTLLSMSKKASEREHKKWMEKTLSDTKQPNVWMKLKYSDSFYKSRDFLRKLELENQN